MPDNTLTLKDAKTVGASISVSLQQLEEMKLAKLVQDAATAKEHWVSWSGELSDITKAAIEAKHYYILKQRSVYKDRGYLIGGF